tara:strand:+ start:427 stop:750 length:324 start_codon:yes stop_codon:yes gene_type:complete
MDRYIEDNPLIVTLLSLLVFIYCLVVMYGRYLKRKKKEKAQIKLRDLKNMSKEQLDSLSYMDRSRLINEILRKWRNAPIGTESEKAKEEYMETANLLGVDYKPGDLF